MLSKAFAWGVVAVVISSAAWWMLDPVAFSQNPGGLNGLTLRSQGYRR